MTCDYKNAFEHKQLTDVCDHLGNKWLDFIEAVTAVGFNRVFGWGKKRVGDMYDGSSEMLDEYMSLYASENDTIWETTQTANFALERQLKDIGVDIYAINQDIPIYDGFGKFWRNQKDRGQHRFRVNWLETMEKKLFVYWGVLFLWAHDKHGYAGLRLNRLYRFLREQYIEFAELYLMCREKENYQMVGMIEKLTREANAICGDVEVDKAYMTIDEFIKQQKKSVIEV